MAEEEKTERLPSDVTDFLGMGERKTGGGTFVRPPSFAGGTDDFDDRTKNERKARFKASADMLFSTDVSKLDDAGASALYQSVTEGMFGLPDEDGSVAFGKRASKDPCANIDMLRKFVKGDYTLIEDPEYTKWRQMDDEAKFKYALEHETTGNMVKSKMKGERGTNPLVAMAAGDMSAFAIPWTEEQRKGQEIDREWREDAIRNSFYDSMDEEKKAAYRADVIADYDTKLSRRQTLATFLQFAHGLSDRAGYLLAKSFSDGTPDAANIEGLPEDERDRVYAAFSLMRGDQKKGRILGIQTDFTDDTWMNRFQLGLYGFQQSVVGLVTDTGEMARDAAMWTYAKCAMDEDERKAFFKGWDAIARAEQAMKQNLPEADSLFGEAFQGLAENMHWFIPYSMIGKGGKLAKGAQATIVRAKLQKEVAEGGLTLAKAAAEASRTRWLADVEGAVKAGKGAKKVSEFASAIAMRRQLAAVDQYTAALREIPNVVKAAKWKDAAGAGMWAAGEASAFSAFASEYIANADAAGISREESILTAAAIGLINAKIEQLYVPGLESSLAPAQIKSLTFAAMAQAIKTDGAAGFRKWLANRVSKGFTEGVKVTLTEGAVEEPLQQMAIEHGKAFDKLCQELRKDGNATLANEAKALWDSFAATLPNDYATFIDTAADMVPSSLGFGVTTIGNMTRRQHIHNAMTRHANRRAGATAEDTMLSLDQRGEDPSKAFDYDAGLVDVIQQAVNVRAAVEKHWQGEEDGDEAENPHRFEEAITAARRAWRDPQTGDAVQEIADAAGVDVKTAEVMAQYLQTEAEATAFSPQARAWTSLNMSLADIDEATIKTVLPGYVDGSFASDPENGIYSGRVRMDDGTEKTIAYRVGDFSDELRAEADENAKIGSAFGDSFNERHEELGDGIRWEMLSDAQRYQEALFASNAARMGSGVFELTDSKGQKVRVNADSVIRLANGHIADIGYGPAATQATVRHETFHSLWQFVRGTLADADVQQLAKTLGIDVTADNWERKLDERMAHEMERYASGHYVSHAVSSRFDKMLDSWAGKIIKFFGQFGPSDEVTDPKTGKPYQLKGLYDRILRGELGSGTLGVELRKVPQQTAEPTATPKSSMPVEVTDADRAEAEAEAQAEIKEEEPSPAPASPAPTVTPAPTAAPVQAATAEHPADAATPNQRYYKVGLPNSPVKLVGRLEVRDVETGVITSTDADYHDRGNQNRDDKSEESRALVEKIGANPDPLQIGTVQPIANNGIVWLLNNSNVIIGNHRVNGARLAYAKGTAGELEKFVREDAARRGIEIGDDVKKPLLVFVLERIESPDGKADVHEVVRLANESQNRGFNVREQASNDAKILIDNNLLPRMEFRADGRIDETKSGDAIGKFRQETGAQGMVAEDGSLTEEGQTRIQNAALAVLLGGEGNNALLNKIMSNAGRLDMQSELRALMKMTPELMALADAKPAYDLRAPLAEALQLFTEWRDKDETARTEKGKTRHDWRETAKDGTRKRGLSWEAFMSQGDMFRAPSDEARILGDLFAKSEQLRSFDREDVESEAGKKRVIDLISGYLADYIKNARAVNTETEDMFGGTPATRAEVMAAQRAAGEGGARFSLSPQAQLEYDEVVARYTNEDGTKKRGWMKAPNGKPTRLNESQWVMVRTPTFKKWFGDWEKAEITKRWFDIEASGILDGIATVDISSVQPLANKDAIAEAFVDFGIVTNGRDGRKVRFPGNTAGKMVYQRKYVAAYKKLFESAIRCWSEKENPVEGHKDHTSNIENYHHYVNKFKSAEGEFFVHFTVRESKTSTVADKNLVHAAEVSDVFVYNASANLAGSQTGSLGAGSTGRKPHADRKISYFLSGVNPGNEDCSKIVDANGEPLVVYRGAAFDPLAQETGKGVVMPEAYFTGDQEYAKRYGNVRAYYLDIRRPFDIRDPKCLADLKKAYPDHEFQTGKSGALDWGEASVVDGEFLKDNFGDKYDGIVYDEGGDPAENEQGYTLRGVSYVPLDGGAQVKSATDNNGEFSGNPDVRYSVSTEGLSETEKTNLRAAQTEAQRVLDQIGGTELGNSINRDFHGEARTTLIGKTIRTAKDLAALAQVYRNPCFETFRYIFTRNGEVVWQTGVTARLPGASATTVHTPRENTYAEIERMIAKVKPDGVWLLHNHPSGNVFPSRADINVTGELRTYFDRQGVFLDGHVIIDHDQYAEMNQWGDYNIRRMSAADLEASFHGNPFEKPTKDNAAFHDSLRESGEKFGLDNIAVFYARLQRMASERGKMLTFITVDSKANFVTSVANVPTETFDGADDKRITDILADYRGATGGAFLFVVGDQSMDDYGMAAQQAIYRQIENGNVTDVLWQDASGKWGSVRSYDPLIVDNKKVNRLTDSRTSRVDLGEARYSVSRELTDAMRKREIMQGIPVEGAVQPWPANFPKVMIQTTLASVKQKWLDLHTRAKAGSEGAALELVRNILGEATDGKKKNPKWEKLRALAAEHPRAIVAYVHAEEATGRNKIPAAYAFMIHRITGLRFADGIVQTVRANHTGANAVERMMRVATFSGPVQRGAEYILVDDHVTQGGTLNELRKYIQSRGGKIVAISTLTASQFSDTIAISSDAMQALYAKFGNNLDEELKEAGIANGVAELTQSQARELRKLRADTLRDRLAAARLRRNDEALLRNVRRGLLERSGVSGATDLLPGLKDYLKPDGTSTETGTRWARAKQFQRPIGRELNAIIDEALNAGDLSAEETAALLDRLITSAEATDEILNGVLPNFRKDSALDDPTAFVTGEDGKPHPTPERLAVHRKIYDLLMADSITGKNNEALETRKDGTAKEEALIVAANEGRPDLPPIPLQNPSYETQRDFRIDIIVGPPAAGKSSVFANALSVWYRSRVLDCDACKKELPGFNDGNGANYVHAESSMLNKQMIRDIQNRAEGDPRRGENVVLPVLGDDAEGLRKKIADWHAAGYTVYLHNNRVPILHAFGRALLRTLATGRWINPVVIRACQDNPTRAYNLVKKEADYYDQFSNDVTIGQKPIWEDGNYLDPAYGEVRRAPGGEDRLVEASDGTGAAGRLGRPGLLEGKSWPATQGTLFSTEAPRSGLVYPQLRGMSDEELLSAAVAARIALGKSDKVSDRSVKVTTVQKMMRRLHPEWDTTKIGVESQRVMSGAQKLARRIRDDIGRGVSDSLVLEHLPDTMREQFGREMRQEAREGARLGAFGARANTALEERQAQIVEDAVRVQTGLDSGAIENAYGINLSETIMHLADNPLTEKDAPQGTSGEGEGTADEEGAASAEESEEAAVEIDAKVKAVVDDIVSASGRQTGVDEQNRKNRKAAAGRDAENEAAMGEGEEALEAEGDSSGEGTEGDALAEAVKKSALNLENPRHLARFVAELARRQWIKEHGLAKDADVWRDLVAVQFLRKTAQSVYAKLCRDLTYSRSRETAMRGIAKLDSVPTVQGLISEMEFLGALINAQRIRDTQKQMCEKLDLFLRESFSAQGRFKPDKEEGKRKVSAEAELRARYMRHAMWLTPDAAAEEARQLQETLDALSVDFADAGRDRDQSREFVETIRKLNVLREFGALRYKPVGEIEAAVQWWQDFARGESDDIVREMSDRDIRTKKAAHLLAVAFADPKRTTIREGGKADALNRFITGHMGFISLLQDCMRHASDADAAAVKDIVDYIAREVQKAGDRSEAEKRRHNDAFHSAVEGIYGKSFNAVMKDMMAPDERFTQYMGVVGGKRVTPTKGRALQLLVSLLQEGRKVQVEDEENPGQTKTVWEGGYHDNIVKHHREGQAAEIMRLLDPADMNMLKWLGQWYENNRSDLSGVCHSLFGIGVYAELPNYFPVKMMLETQGLEKGQGVGWTIFPKALTPRVRNERDFDTSADIFSMWASRMEEAAQWKHHAQLGLEMRGIFGRSELRETVRANHGASVDDLMQGFITDILAGHGAYDRSTAGVQYFSDQIRGWTALCALGGNIGVMAKQTTSIPAFGFEIGLVNTAKYMVSAFTPEGMAAMGKIWDSEQRRTRWNLGSSEAVRNALSQQNAGWLKRMLQKSMITTKLGDVVPALVVGQGIYRDCLDRGMSEDDAMAETWSIIERTQQSGRMENQTSIQRRNKLGRIMFQFLSTQQQYLQYEVRAIREVIARPDSVKRWGSLGRAILLNHFILSSAYFWMGELYKACLGQEPPEDELNDWIITCLLGPYGSLFVAGFCCKYTLERAIKGYSIKGGSSMLPMESWLKNQVNDGAKLLEAIFDSDGDTWDNMLDAAGRWMSDSNSVVRDLRKIYRYRVKDEPQKK